MRRIGLVLLLAALLLSLCACGGEGAKEQPPAAETEAESATQILLQGSGAEIQGGGAKVQGTVVTIGAVGSYRLSGNLDEGQIVVDTGENAMDVTLILDGVRIQNSSDAAIWVRQAKNLRLQLRGENLLISGTPADLAAFDGTASGAALYSEDDVDLEGDGSLEILGYLNNGITCKDDLDVNSGTLKITAANNGLRGSESVEIKGGSVTITAGNDGVKATSAKKPGKGYVEISGGSLWVDSAGDGISAVSDLTISGGSVTLFTEKQALQAEGALRFGACELLALCDSRKQIEPESSDTPYLLCAMSGRGGDALRIGQESVQAVGDYKMVLYASATLQKGAELELNNGRDSMTTTVK